MIELSDRLEAERRLAQLLGHKNLRFFREFKDPGNQCWYEMEPIPEDERSIATVGLDMRIARDIPKYTRDFAAAFYLATEQACWPFESKLSNGKPVYTVYWLGEDGFSDREIVYLHDHPNKAFAAMWAIVAAVTAKLEAKEMRAAGI